MALTFITSCGDSNSEIVYRTCNELVKKESEELYLVIDPIHLMDKDKPEIGIIIMPWRESTTTKISIDPIGFEACPEDLTSALFIFDDKTRVMLNHSSQTGCEWNFEHHFYSEKELNAFIKKEVKIIRFTSGGKTVTNFLTDQAKTDLLTVMNCISLDQMSD